jgi:hypothetical protein
MQNMHQMNLGHSNKTIISRKLPNLLKLKYSILYALILLQIADMLIQQMLTGLDILQVARLSSAMFECSVDITWYNIISMQATTMTS